MGKLSTLTDALNHNGFARTVVEGGTEVAQNALVPELSVVDEAVIGATIASIPKALQRNPNAPFSPSYKNRFKAGFNNFTRVLPKSFALAAIYNALFNTAEAFSAGIDQREEERRRREEELKKYKDLAPAGMYTLPMNWHQQM